MLASLSRQALVTGRVPVAYRIAPFVLRKQALSTATTELPVDQLHLHGALSAEKKLGGIQPWRVPTSEIELLDPGLVVQAAAPSGVRLKLRTSSQTIRLTALPLKLAQSYDYDLCIDSELVATQRLAPIDVGPCGGPTDYTTCSLPSSCR